jgi:hypothetical protein
VEQVELLVTVREGDWATFRSPSGNRILHWITDSPEFTLAASAGDETPLERWRQLDQRLLDPAMTVSVPAGSLVRDVMAAAWETARDQDLLWRPEEDRQHAHPDGPRRIRAWIADPATDREIPGDATVREAGLDTGDLVSLCIEWQVGLAYMLEPAPDPESLFRSLQIGAGSRSPYGLPRLWGILLYTDADAELATYVRVHFDELNALSGPILRVFVLERPESWASARRYWRANLEPSLYRVLGTLRWLRWKPYERHRAHDIARALDIHPGLLPCLVLLRSPGGSSRITFPITTVSTGYLRQLFGGIQQAIGSDRRPDTEAFDRVLAAEERIKRAMLPAPGTPGRGVPGTYIFNGYSSVLTYGKEMQENFNFYGPATFINRPVDTVVQDFQNVHSSTEGRGDLVALLRLVLSSADIDDSTREEAAGLIHEVAGELEAPERDASAIRAKLGKLRAAVSRVADIAEPALSIISSVLRLLRH